MVLEINTSFEKLDETKNPGIKTCSYTLAHFVDLLHKKTPTLLKYYKIFLKWLNIIKI